MNPFVLCLFLSSLQLQAQNAPQPVAVGTAASEETELMHQIARALQDDPALRQALSERILKSSLAGRLSNAQSPEAAASEIDDWILQNPEAAASLRVGFTEDDLNGTHNFEHSLYERVVRYFELNPKREKGILGNLKAAGIESKSILRRENNLGEEEQHELLKRIFEGQEAGAHRAPPKPGPTPDRGQSNIQAGAGGPSVFAGNGIYDRLSAVRPTGYSPEVLALQSALNAQRIPNAPHIPETGRLDFATLAAPYFSLRHDLNRLESSLKEDQSETSTTSPSQAGEGTMTSVLSNRKKREQALKRAAQALETFKQTVERSKQPSQITVPLLKSLGRRQKEAARWITIASLEVDLERLESLPDRWPKKLLDKIRAAPIDEPTRQAYLLKGQRLLDRLASIKQTDERVLSFLDSQEFLSHWDEAQHELARVAPLRGDLRQQAFFYSTVPYLLSSGHHAKSVWRAFLDRWIARILPSSAYGRRLLREQRERASLETAFRQVAAGNYAGAATSLTENP